MSTPRLTNGEMAIDLRGVAKTYGRKVKALRGVDMQVGRGEVFGLLGPNGAGKSTLVKILMTVIRASHCEGHVLGHPVGHKPTLTNVGYLPEHHKFPDYLTGAQVLDFYGALGGADRATRKSRQSDLLELLGMSKWATTRVRKYSKGMRQRTGIAQALMNDPDLVLLDEPTDGVDPVGRRDIREVVMELRNRGKTVFINSHLLSELEMVCDRVAILVQGDVVAQGTIDELTADQVRYEIEFTAPEQGPDSIAKALPSAVQRTEDDHVSRFSSGLARRATYHGELATGEVLEVREDRVAIGTLDPAAVQPILDGLRAHGVVIRSVRPVRPSLEDLFMQAVTDPSTGETLKPGAASSGTTPRKRGEA
ncbi:MAG: ABC transporter ATP-binding protein [Planctomycetota bacterium]